MALCTSYIYIYDWRLSIKKQPSIMLFVACVDEVLNLFIIQLTKRLSLCKRRAEFFPIWWLGRWYSEVLGFTKMRVLRSLFILTISIELYIACWGKNVVCKEFRKFRLWHSNVWELFYFSQLQKWSYLQRLPDLFNSINILKNLLKELGSLLRLKSVEELASSSLIASP